MFYINLTIATITLNVNVLNTVIKKQRLSECTKLKKERNKTIYHLQETHLKYKDIYRLK